MKNMFTSKPSRITVQPLIYNLTQTLEDILFPTTDEMKQGYLKVSDIHSIWYGELGNPSGIPVLVVHGGPGASCSKRDMRFFDPKFYRIILFDQRGAGKSNPAGEMKENTTQNLVSDMEVLRKYLKVEKWLMFGGSWGSALSLAYGEIYSEQCLGFILRGIFLGTMAEANQLWFGMKDLYPEAFDEFINYLPENERSKLIEAFYERLINPDPKVHLPAANAFVKYDTIAAYALKSPPLDNLGTDQEILNLARTFTHYCMNEFFLQDNQLVDNIHKISHLPLIIIHGRFDAICRASSAYKLHKIWQNSELNFIQDAGHSASEEGIAKALVAATEKMKLKL